MDTFFEQIVPIKKTAKEFILLFLVWLLAGVLAAFLVLFVLGPAFGLIAAGLIFYGAFHLSKRLFIEFEYIVTNNILDIDKIIAKSSRKRVVSIDIADISEIKKYNPANSVKREHETRVLACDPDDQNAFEITAKGEHDTLKIIIAPNDRIKEGIIKSLPKYIGNSAFRV